MVTTDVELQIITKKVHEFLFSSLWSKEFVRNLPSTLLKNVPSMLILYFLLIFCKQFLGKFNNSSLTTDEQKALKPLETD